MLQTSVSTPRTPFPPNLLDAGKAYLSCGPRPSSIFLPLFTLILHLPFLLQMVLPAQQLTRGARHNLRQAISSAAIAEAKFLYGSHQVPRLPSRQDPTMPELLAYNAYMKVRMGRLTASRRRRAATAVLTAMRLNILPQRPAPLAMSIARAAIRHTMTQPWMRTFIRRLQRRVRRRGTALPLPSDTVLASSQSRYAPVQQNARSASDVLPSRPTTFGPRYLNLTASALPEALRMLLRRGYTFCPTPSPMDIADICASTEMAIAQLGSHDAAAYARTTVLTAVHRAGLVDNLSCSERRALNDLLSPDAAFIAVPADKDKLLVILERDRYSSLFKSFLREAYTTIPPPPSKSYPAAKFNRKLRKVLTSALSPANPAVPLLMKKFKAANAFTARLRGTIKTHKFPPPLSEDPSPHLIPLIKFRPVCNAKNAAAYNLQKSLLPLVRAVCAFFQPSSMLRLVENSVELKTWMNSTTPSTNDIICRSDVVDMFTQVDRIKATACFITLLRSYDLELARKLSFMNAQSIPLPTIPHLVEQLLTLSYDMPMAFDGEYFATSCFPQGAPLSGMLCSLFVSFLEAAVVGRSPPAHDPPNRTSGRRYADDSIFMGPNTDVRRTLCSLNRSLAIVAWPDSLPDANDHRVYTYPLTDPSLADYFVLVVGPYGVSSLIHHCVSGSCTTPPQKVYFKPEYAPLTSPGSMLDLAYVFRPLSGWDFDVHRKPTKSLWRTSAEACYPARYHWNATHQYVIRALRLCSSPSNLDAELSFIERQARLAGLGHSTANAIQRIRDRAQHDFDRRPKVWVLADTEPTVRLASVINVKRLLGTYALSNDEVVQCPSWLVRPASASADPPRPWSFLRFRIIQARQVATCESPDASSDANRDERPLLILPYLGRQAESAIAPLSHLFKVSYRITTVARMVIPPTSTRFPAQECGTGIYAMVCACNAIYVGRTMRSFAERAAEHRRAINHAYSAAPPAMADDDDDPAAACGPAWHVSQARTSGQDPGVHNFDAPLIVAIRSNSRNLVASRVLEALAAGLVSPSLSINARTDHADPYRALFKLHSGWTLLLKLFSKDWTLRLLPNGLHPHVDINRIHDVRDVSSDSGSDSSDSTSSSDASDE